MSELVVQPGDTLIYPCRSAPRTPAEVREIQELLKAELPGVTVIIVTGMAGGPFVYRPGGAA